MSKLEYCAGIFDGEGSISIRRFTNKKHPQYRPRHELHIEVNQVRPEAIHFLHMTLGGRRWFSPRNGKYSGRWFWTEDSGNAARVLELLLPHLLIKVDEAKLAILFQSTKLSRDTGRSFKAGITQEEWDIREEMYLELKRLKHIHDSPEVQAEYLAESQALAVLSNTNGGVVNAVPVANAI